MKEDPQALLDPATARTLRETVADAGDISVADSLLNSLNLALERALSDVFTVLWIAVALSFLVALFLRVRPVKPHQDSELEASAQSRLE